MKSMYKVHNDGLMMMFVCLINWIKLIKSIEVCVLYRIVINGLYIMYVHCTAWKFVNIYAHCNLCISHTKLSIIYIRKLNRMVIGTWTVYDVCTLYRMVIGTWTVYDVCTLYRMVMGTWTVYDVCTLYRMLMGSRTVYDVCTL